MPTALETRNLAKAFALPDGRIVPVFSDLSVKLQAGRITCIVGPSGCGKTTFLRTIAGLLCPDSGAVLVDGEVKALPPGSMAFMFQTNRLLPWRTALQNVLLGGEVIRLDGAERLNRARDLLGSFGLADFENAFPEELSEGMRQRVAFARSLLIRPKILLLDEPFSSVDYEVKLQLERALLKTVAEQKITAVIVTHDLEEAIVLAQDILVFSKRPAKIIASYCIGAPLDDRDPLTMRQSRTFAEMLGQLGRQVLNQE